MKLHIVPFRQDQSKNQTGHCFLKYELWSKSCVRLCVIQEERTCENLKPFIQLQILRMPAVAWWMPESYLVGKSHTKIQIEQCFSERLGRGTHAQKEVNAHVSFFYILAWDRSHWSSWVLFSGFFSIAVSHSYGEHLPLSSEFLLVQRDPWNNFMLANLLCWHPINNHGSPAYFCGVFSNHFHWLYLLQSQMQNISWKYPSSHFS